MNVKIKVRVPFSPPLDPDTSCEILTRNPQRKQMGRSCPTAFVNVTTAP